MHLHQFLTISTGTTSNSIATESKSAERLAPAATGSPKRSPFSRGKAPQALTLFWFSLSMTFGLGYGLLALRQALNGDYLIQDDARQHVFWMQRFLDPELFPNDLIADYFQSVAPSGYSALYHAAANLGIDPILFSKLLPTALSAITTFYCFGVSLEIFPLPMAGFLSSLLLNHNLWIQGDGFTAATAKSFLYPLLLAFLYYLLRRSIVPCMVAVFLAGLFYPPLVLVLAGILILHLLHWRGGLPRISLDRRNLGFCVVGLAIAGLVLIPYALANSNFGPVVTGAEARTMPEFFLGGRTSFFFDKHWSYYWFEGSRSSLRIFSLISPPWIGLAALLPFLLAHPERFPLGKLVRPGINILTNTALVSLGLFFAAHLLLFKLYLPSRYSGTAPRITLTIAAGIAIAILIDALFRRWQRRQVLAVIVVAVLGIGMVGYPNLVKKTFPWTGYMPGTMPELYQFLAQQPKDTLIASLSREGDNLPTFAQRSVLVSREFGLAYHLGYYRQFRQRALHQVEAQYTPNPQLLKSFIDRYGVDFWLLDAAAFTPDYLAKNNWIKQFQPAANEAIAQFKQGKIPALQIAAAQCVALQNDSVLLLDTRCIQSLIDAHSIPAPGSKGL